MATRAGPVSAQGYCPPSCRLFGDNMNPKIKQWMRREDNPPPSENVNYEIKSDGDLQDAFSCDEEQD